MGRVINGPANAGLESVDQNTASRHDKARGAVQADSDRR
jgi:hypothetical protein